MAAIRNQPRAARFSSRVRCLASAPCGTGPGNRPDSGFTSPGSGLSYLTQINPDSRNPSSRSRNGAIRLGTRPVHSRAGHICRRTRPPAVRHERTGTQKAGPAFVPNGASATLSSEMARSKPWTQEEIDLLRKLHAEGASPVRISAALKKSLQSVRHRARTLGLLFETMHETKRKRLERERSARLKAGLTADQ